MIVLDHDQGSIEWIEARLGIPTASEFSRIITPTGKLSKLRGTATWASYWRNGRWEASGDGIRRHRLD